MIALHSNSVQVFTQSFSCRPWIVAPVGLHGFDIKSAPNPLPMISSRKFCVVNWYPSSGLSIIGMVLNVVNVDNSSSYAV